MASEPIRMAQYGTGHGHAGGKLAAMGRNPEVEVAGVFEPDPARRRQLEAQPGAYEGVRWFADAGELLGDPSIVAVASEGRNDESLDQTEALVTAGKHVWYDKPAGDNWEQWQRVVAAARARDRLIQMGYMFRYQDGFQRLAEWVKSGLLGEVFQIRAHMSTNIDPASRRVIGVHIGGILYDLAGHMLDQIVWMLGRPTRVTSYLRNDSGEVPEFSDNTLGVFEYDRAMATVDISAMETPPMARRFEIYGTRGSAIMDPMEGGDQMRLCLDEDRDGWSAGVQVVPVPAPSRMELYERELVAFLAALRGDQPPDRPLEHELLVQETLLRATGGIPGG